MTDCESDTSWLTGVLTRVVRRTWDHPTRVRRWSSYTAILTPAATGSR